MNMPMMDVGPVHMCMRYRFVHMYMIVLPFVFSVIVLMEMVLLMLMGMGVGKLFMPVKVPVHFPIEAEHPRKHNQRRHPILSGWALSKNYDGEDGADERS